MTEGLLARKGEANPATTHHGGESRFQAQRVVVLPPIALHRIPVGESGQRILPRRAANMAKPLRAPVNRRKFTFRIEPDRHATFCAAADKLGISRQEFLTRALDAYLETLRDQNSGPPSSSDLPAPFEPSQVPDHASTLQLPF